MALPNLNPSWGGCKVFPKCLSVLSQAQLHTVDREAVPFLSPAQSTGISPSCFIPSDLKTPEPNWAGPVAGLTIQKGELVTIW